MLRYPAFDELPDGLISLQDLVAVVNAAHGDLPLRARNRHKAFTASMASNYVKQKLTPPPVGKRYTRLHVCMILFAATIKLAYSTEDVLDITGHVFQGAEDEASLQALQDQLADAFNTKTNAADAPAATEDATLTDLATSTFAQKVRSLILLDEL